MTTLVIAEHNQTHLKLATRSVITAALALGKPISVLIIGYQCSLAAEEAATIEGVDQVLKVDASEYEHALPEVLAPLIVNLASNYDNLLAPATSFGKNILPRVAGMLDMAQVSDVIEILTPNTFVRPIYAGNALETVQNQDTIQLLTIRPIAYPPANFGNYTAPITSITVAAPLVQTTWLSHTTSEPEKLELTNARIVISGGRGLGSAENFVLLEKIAKKLKAAIGASRAAVDAEFAPNAYQIGQTGKVIAPDLYIAVGISGAAQHTAGMKDSKVIVAINKDPNAAIFEIADYGLVGDLFSILPELEKLL